MTKTFASASDLAGKAITFKEIGRDLYAFTAEGDPNSGAIVANDGAIVVEAQATPALAGEVIERVRKPFNVSRAYDEAQGIDTPRIWTAERDRAMCTALQGQGA